MTRHVLAFLGLMIAAVPGGNTASLIDPIQLRLLEAYAQSVRWENIESARTGWRDGQHPTWSLQRRFHQIELDGDETVSVIIPPRTVLMILPVETGRHSDSIVAQLSDGSGMFAETRMHRGPDGESYRIEPNHGAPLLCRLRLRDKDFARIAFGLFTSRTIHRHEIAPYRERPPLPPPSRRARLKRSDPPSSNTFFSLTPGDPVTVLVRGPNRVAIENRLRYSPAVSARLQHYALATELNQDPMSIWRFESRPEDHALLRFEGEWPVLGRLRRVFVDVPSGTHPLTLQSDASLVVRVLGLNPTDYLVPRWNSPHSPEDIAFQTAPWPRVPTDSSSPWATLAAGGEPSWNWLAWEEAAENLARSNTHKAGGLAAVALLESVARSRPDYPALQNRADSLRGAYSGFRNILPTRLRPSQTIRFARVRSRSLADDNDQSLILARQHLVDALSSLTGAYFVSSPNDLDDGGQNSESAPAWHYALPRSKAPSELKILMPLTGRAREFELRIDGGPPRRISILPGVSRPLREYPLSPAESALHELAASNSDVPLPPTLSGPFSRYSKPAPLISAGASVIPIPPETRQITLRPVNVAVDGERESVAVQVRQANTFSLDGDSYLRRIQHLELNGVDIYQLFTQTIQGPAPERRQAGDLADHWQPLRRYLRAARDTFLSGVIANPPAPAPAWHDPDLQETTVARARDAERNEQWLSALENWSNLAHHGDLDRRPEARLSAARALSRLSEHFLAEIQLKGMLMFPGPENPEHESRLAFGQLRELYRENDDSQGLLGLYATRLLQASAAPTDFAAFAELLIEDGRYDDALTIGLSLPRDTQPASSILRSALISNSMSVFEETLPRLDGSREMHFWKGQALLRHGATTEASEQFAAAGAEGAPMLDAIARALDIRARSMAADLDRRRAALFEWENWVEQQPGPFTWDNAAESVIESAGTALLYSPTRDLYQRYHVADPNQPARIRIQGPATLRITVRPVHVAETNPPIDGWWQIQSEEESDQFPIIGNWPTQSLQWIGEESRLPGRAIRAEWSAGSGEHVVLVSAPRSSLLVQVEARRPELEMGILPPLTPETVAAVRDLPNTAGEPPPKRRWTRLDRRLILLPTDPSGAIERFRARDILEDALPETDKNKPPSDPSAARQTEDTTGQRRRENPTDPTPANLGEIQALPESSPEETRRKMTWLLWWLEHRPDQLLATEAIAQALAHRHPTFVAVEPMLGRITARTTWSPVTSIQSNGIRFVQVDGWNPGAPNLRVRKALIEPRNTRPESHWLHSDDTLVLNARLKDYSELDLSLEYVSLPYLKMPPLRVLVWTDVAGLGEKQIELTTESRIHRQTLHLPAGEHQVRVRIVDRAANQFLKLRIRESLKGNTGAAPNGDPWKNATERSYHVATPEKPVEATIRGPAWIRIDSATANSESSHYRYVPDGWHVIPWPPEDDRRHSMETEAASQAGDTLVRIFRREHRLDTPPDPQPPIAIQYDAVPAVPVDFSESGLLRPTPANEAENRTNYPPAAHEDGTWSVTLALENRINLEEEDESGPADERYLQIDLTHRYYSESAPAFYKTRGFGRIRDHGGMLLGLGHDTVWTPRWSSLTIRGSAGFHAQNPAADRYDILGAGTTEWSGTLRATVSQRRAINTKWAHVPYASANQTWLSMDRNDRYKRERLDRDIFTAYKADHRRGLSIGDTVHYRPWLDTLLSAGASVGSNEDFNIFSPDRARVQWGWQQLLGPLDAEIRYRATRYFSDSDRRNAATRQSVDLRLNGQWVVNRRDWIRTGIHATYDIDHQQWAAGIHVTWHFDQPRGLRDFRSSEIPFKDLRQRDWPDSKKDFWFDE